MWKLESQITNLRKFSVNSLHLSVLLKGGQLRTFHKNDLNKYLWEIQLQDYGDIFLMRHFLFWNDYIEKNQMFNLHSGDTVDLNFKANESFFYHAESTIGSHSSFFAYFNDQNNKHYQSKFQIIDNKLNLIWKKENFPLRFINCEKEGAIYIVTDIIGELIKINAEDGNLIWKKIVISTGENFEQIIGTNSKSIFLWTNKSCILAVNLISGEVEWKIDEWPRPERWSEESPPLRFSNMRIHGESLMVGMIDGYFWKINLINGFVEGPINHNSIFISENISDQSSICCYGDDLIIFIDEFKRNLISFNWKTEKIESITAFPIQGKEMISPWKGPILEGNKCYLLDTFGTLHIFENQRVMK